MGATESKKRSGTNDGGRILASGGRRGAPAVPHGAEGVLKLCGESGSAFEARGEGAAKLAAQGGQRGAIPGRRHYLGDVIRDVRGDQPIEADAAEHARTGAASSGAAFECDERHAHPERDEIGGSAV